ncbi:MAG: branched-chain amino acid ABC transporter permease, partial [Hadesarchaea archaeon]|nr:branched-chain amino acid ABC transporter permease [Hadesarchaea archaeon]
MTKGKSIVLETLIPITIVGLLIGCVYALMAFGLSIQFGVMNLINFAHGDFVMLAMYVTYFSFLAMNLPTLASPILTVPLFFGIGFFLYKVTLKKIIKSSQLVQIAATVGMFMAMRGIAFLFFVS